MARRARFRALVTMLLIVLCALVPTTAVANTHSIAVFVDGPGAGAVRNAVVKVVPPGIDVVESKRFREALVRVGQTKPFENLDKKAVTRLRRAAGAVGAEAVLVVHVGQDQKSRFVKLLVVDVLADVLPAQGARLGLKPSDKDSEDLSSLVADRLKPYAPPEEAAATPAVEPPAPVPEKSPPPPPEVAPPAVVTSVPPPVDSPAPRPANTPARLVATSLLDIALGAEAAGRHCTYDNGITRTPYVYDLTAALAARVRGSVFPLATRGSPLGDLAVSFDYSRLFLQKSDFDGASQGTATSYSLGLRGRIHPAPAGGDPPVILGLFIQYAFSSFSVAGPANAEVPGVAYRALRPGLDVRIPFGSFSLLGATAFRGLINTDSISPRFYAPHGFGFDAELGAALMFVRHFEARLSARYEYYALGLTPPPGANFSPGRNTDQWYSLGVSLAFVF
jgi:hypothetical protein